MMHDQSAPPMISLQPQVERPVALEILRGLNRHRILFGMVALATAGLCAGVIEALPTRYTAFASVVVASALPDPLQSNAQQESVLRDDEVATQAALMTSRDLAAVIVKRFDVGAAPGVASHLHVLACAWAASLTLTRPPCAPRAEPTTDDRITSFLARLKATPAPRTRLIDLSYTDASPEVAAAALNAVVESYQAQQIAQRSQDLNRTSTWISERSGALRRNWLDAEAKAGRFRTQSGLTPSGSRENSAPLITQQVASAATSLSAAQAELSAARARQGALRSATSTTDRTAFLAMRDEPTLVALATQLAPLKAQLADMKQHFNKKFPGLPTLEAQVSSLEAQIRSETKRALRGVEVELQVKQEAVESLGRTLRGLRGDAADANARQVDLSTLDDEARSARTVYETFLGRAKQLDDRAELLQSQVQFAAHATAPGTPSFPDRPRLWLGAAVLGLAFGMAAVWLREFLARGFSNISRIGGQLALPFLCAIPAIDSRRERRRLPQHVHEHPFSSAAESMRTLLTHFQLEAPGSEAVRSVVIASATGQEGKTTTSIWLASAAARGGRRILLIDGDHRRGMINQRLHGVNTLGFSDVVFGDAAVGEVLQHDARQGFDFIGAGAPVSRSFGASDVKRLKQQLLDLEDEYDLVIIDTPPLLAVTDALLYASLANATVFLCRWSRTSRQAVACCLERLRSANANLLGIALSMVDQRRLAHFSDEITPYDVRVMKRYYVR
jgi:succinoglycan biosynthesis transport protein ExoP